MKKLMKKILRKICTYLGKRKVAYIGENVRINFPCRFTSKTTIGDNCHFNGIDISGNGEVKIGDNFHSGKECMIITSFHNFDKGTAIPYDNTYIDKNVIIEDNVWLGSRVIILGGVTIGEGAVIQAGSVVVKNIPPLAVAGGHPASVFKYRDVEHYNLMKKEGKFF